MKRVAIVVQRYGPEVTGGSEALARALAERLARELEVTVFTTCAVDYVTWRNDLPAGEEELDGVRVRRFPAEQERDLAAFNRLSDELYARAHSREEELEWLRRQGPEVPALVAALAAAQDDFDGVLFFTYLYYPTYWGLREAGRRSVLVPTAHDEPALRLGIFEEVFARPRAFAFLTRPEEALVRRRFALGHRPAAVAGVGVEAPASADVDGFRARHGLEGDYVLYAGRIDAGKGCRDMLEHFRAYRREAAAPAQLVLIGRLAMPEPREAGVRYLGFLPEGEKQAAVAGAAAVVCPSPYESLSLALLEAFAAGVPGLATARSPVLTDHCLSANAGLFYADGEEFVEALRLLVEDRTLRGALGENGRRYVAARYRWDVVLERYRALVAAAAEA